MAAFRLAKIPGALVAGATPVVGLMAFPRVQASGTKIHPSELDIYDKPVVYNEVVLDDKRSALELKVSSGRRALWGYWDDVKVLVEKTRSAYEIVSTKSVEFVDLITNDQVFQIKFGCISSGVLVGALLAGRGRCPFRRVFYSVGLGAAVASLCYPSKATDISLEGYRKAKMFISDQWTKYQENKPKITKNPGKVLDMTSQTEGATEEKFVIVDKPVEMPETKLVNEEGTPVEAVEITPSESQNSKQVSSEMAEESIMTKVPFVGWFFKSNSSNADTNDENSVVIESQEEKTQEKSDVSGKDQRMVIEPEEVKKPLKVEGDPGQSNPDDKDMYSTRS
ncbi:MICOS complex subunit Mic27 [Nematostella vectensis]|uniref:MICOS complex subunit Mic27 n=1 Tax=Nematostella vectensis TaxID=45351 RepID=UPI002076F8B2|nr:MICOS complex subunit Mic27 [Nematostella vectensis]